MLHRFVAAYHRAGCPTASAVGYANSPQSFGPFRRRRALPLFLAIAFSTSAASAHSLLLSRGDAIVHSDKITLDIDVAAEDLLHLYPIRPNQNQAYSRSEMLNLARSHRESLMASLVVRGAAGERLPVTSSIDTGDWNFEGETTVTEIRNSQFRYSLAYPLESQTRRLTFQLRPDRVLASVQWQLVLTVHGPSQETFPVLRLTTGGNAESLDVLWGDDGAFFPTAFGGPCQDSLSRGSARFKEIIAICRWTDKAVKLDVTIPLPLLTTWVAVDCPDGDFVDLAEHRRITDSFHEFVRTSIAVESQANHMSEPSVITLRVNEVDQPSTVATDRISCWTGALHATLRFDIPHHDAPAMLHWKLFNPTVVSVRSAFDHGGSCQAETLSSYRPHVPFPTR